MTIAGISTGVRVSIRKTFAQFLRKKTQNFSFFAHQFCAKKKQQFAQSFAKVISRKIALFRFCETQVLRKRFSHFVETLTGVEEKSRPISHDVKPFKL